VDYEKASFLDGRLGRPEAARLAFAELETAAQALPLACDWIFHVGHVGSTLMSRLLGGHPRVFGVREPQVLRTLAAGPWRGEDLDRRLAVFQRLWSRVWAPPKRALVKATSMASALAPRILAQNRSARAILMTVAPETYLATILGGANLKDVQAAAPGRIARLAQRLGADPWTGLSPGELAALSWAADMAALAEAGDSGRALWIDFEAFLADPAGGIAAALTHLHGSAEPDAVRRVAASPYLQRYSKAPEYAYTPELRAQVLAQARAAAGAEIARGLAWLDRACADWPAIAHARGAAGG
jgi:hypothetical protein